MVTLHHSLVTTPFFDGPLSSKSPTPTKMDTKNSGQNLTCPRISTCLYVFRSMATPFVWLLGQAMDSRRVSLLPCMTNLHDGRSTPTVVTNSCSTHSACGSTRVLSHLSSAAFCSPTFDSPPSLPSFHTSELTMLSALPGS